MEKNLPWGGKGISRIGDAETCYENSGVRKKELQKLGRGIRSEDSFLGHLLKKKEIRSKLARVALGRSG